MAKVDLSGQTALVTGANAGIGLSFSHLLAKQGATVIMACRTPKKCVAAQAKIVAETKNDNVKTLTLDTSVLASVRAFAESFLALKIDKLDMLFLNAGIPYVGERVNGTLPLSKDGFEMVFATNTVGHHLLYKLLSDTIAAAKPARIVLTSSASSYDSYPYGVATDLKTLNGAEGAMLPYGQSKLSQILWAQELTRQLGDESSVFVNSFHPGAAGTEIWGKNVLIPDFVAPLIDKIKRDFMWTCDEGALTGLYLGVHAGLVDKTVRAKYFHPQTYLMDPPVLTKGAEGEKLQRKMWEFLDSLVK